MRKHVIELMRDSVKGTGKTEFYEVSKKDEFLISYNRRLKTCLLICSLGAPKAGFSTWSTLETLSFLCLRIIPFFLKRKDRT